MPAQKSQRGLSSITAHFKQYRQTVLPDLLAGATGAVAGAPQAMGFAIIAGVSPLYGLYAAVAATITGALVAGSTFMTIAPTNALSVVVGSTLLAYSGDELIGRLFTLTLLVGVFQLAFGVLRLGSLTRFVSNAVMTGFITGAGTLIMLGQLRHLTGYEGGTGSTVLEKFWDWLIHLPASDPQTTVIGVAAVVIIFGLHHTRYKSIATLVAILVTSVFVALVGWEDVALVRDMSAIPNGLPQPILPDLQYAAEMLPAALALAVLASVQSVALSQTVPEADGTIASPTRDLIGQGIANLVGGLFQGMPSGGSLSRTAVNVSAGARTRLANIFAGGLVAVILLAFGSLIERVTLAALAGHLVVAALSLINIGSIRFVWQVNVSARLVMVITFLSTLIFPLEYSIYIGIVLSLVLYVYSSAAAIRVVQLVPDHDHHFREAPVPVDLPDGEPVIFSVTGNLYFAAVHKLEEMLPRPNGSHRTAVILRLRDNQYLGSTGIKFLCRYAKQLQACGGCLMLAGVSPKVRRELLRTEPLEGLGQENVFAAQDVVFAATEQALDQAAIWLAQADKAE
jgi:SulP family sulfate permease